MLLSIFKIQGHSMEPNFHQGDVIVISNILYLFKNPQSGDVILFKDKDSKKQILKRITQIKGEKYIVKGDNIKDSKEFGEISREEILGKVIYQIP